jgi:tetratricopeptide (TPR) repeat protein
MRDQKPWCASAFLFLATSGCGGPAQYDHDIAVADRALAAAQDDRGRAQGHSARGRAYSEKARYSRAFKLIPPEEYRRLFDLAVKDHDQAIALAPDNAQVYFDRGRTYYDRAALEDAADPGRKASFESAKADFTRAIERDGRNALAYDMRGLVYTAADDYDNAIADFTEAMKIDPGSGRARLADAYCVRGSALHRAGKRDPAIADYVKAIEIGTAADGCECQPESPLATLYVEGGRYDEGWDVVHKANGSRRWIAPETLDRLKKASGRDR